MRTEPLRSAWSGYAFALLVAGGCVTPSIRSDLARTRTLSHAERLPAVRGGEVRAEAEPDARALLEQPLDAAAAVRIALLNNRELRAQLRELGIERGRVMQAGLVANPLFEAELLPERDSDVELRVEYDLTSLIFAPLQKRVAELDLEAARIEAASAVVQLGYAVRTAYYALVAGEQRLSLAQRTLDALAAGRDAAVALLEAGNVPLLGASTQIAAYERARISVAQVELEVAELREAMQRLLGLHGEDAAWTVRGGLEAVPEQHASVEEIERRSIEANLALRASSQRLAAIAKRTGIARTAGWLPEVAVDVHTLRTKAEEAGSDDKWRWGAGVSLEVPLFDRGQGERRGYEAEFDGLLERYQGLAIDIRSAAREARNRLVSAHARARQYQTVILPAQRTVMEHTLHQYNAMQIGVFQLLDARRELLDVELAHVDTLREFWGANAELEALLAGSMVETATRGAQGSMGASGTAGGGH